MNQVAAIQMSSGPHVQANLMAAGRLIKEAVDAGAELLVLPENFAILGRAEEDKLKVAETQGKGAIQEYISKQARDYGVWIVAGTIPILSNDPNKVYARSILYDDQGQMVTYYDKIHLFDVQIQGDQRETYIESETLLPGNRPVVVDTPFGRLGMAICYDLRFPGLFRELVNQDAELLVLPSAFTEQTGKAHWEILLRSRAIENLAYVIAAAQGGYHISGRSTYGNSMIVEPWGQVLGRLDKTPGVVKAEIDLDYLRSRRKYFPVLQHRCDRRGSDVCQVDVDADEDTQAVIETKTN